MLYFLDPLIPVFPKDRIISLKNGRKKLLLPYFFSNISAYYPSLAQHEGRKFLFFCKSSYADGVYHFLGIGYYDFNSKTSGVLAFGKEIDFTSRAIRGVACFSRNGSLFLSLTTENSAEIFLLDVKGKRVFASSVKKVFLEKNISSISFFPHEESLWGVCTVKGGNSVFVEKIEWQEMTGTFLCGCVGRKILSVGIGKEIGWPVLYPSGNKFVLVAGVSEGHVYHSEIMRFDADELFGNYGQGRVLTSYKNILLEGVESAYPAFDVTKEELYYTGFGGFHLLYPYTYWHYRKKKLKSSQEVGF